MSGKGCRSWIETGFGSDCWVHKRVQFELTVCHLALLAFKIHSMEGLAADNMTNPATQGTFLAGYSPAPPLCFVMLVTRATWSLRSCGPQYERRHKSITQLISQQKKKPPRKTMPPTVTNKDNSTTTPQPTSLYLGEICPTNQASTTKTPTDTVSNAPAIVHAFGTLLFSKSVASYPREC